MESPTGCTNSSRALLLIVGVFTLALVTTGCSIIFPPLGCPDLEEVCPDLECDTFATSGGCEICQCDDDPEPEPVVCWDSSDCGGGQICNTTDFCETPPGCEDGQPCPDVCYGLCVDPPEECFSNADCSDGEFCRLGGGQQRPAAPCAEGDPDCGAEDALIAPSGICVPAGCDETFDFPACPPGTVPEVDFSEDECGNPVCRPVDDCRQRSVDECESNPGCRLEELPTPCDCEVDPNGGACACPVELVCAPNDACRDLPREECDANPNCESRFIGPPVDCFEECNANGECFVACADEPAPPPDGDPIAPPPEGEFICAPRLVPESCRGDFDCNPNQRCERTVRCDDANCFETPDGQVVCEESCEEFGRCVEVGSSCFDLGEEACLADPRCELADGNGGGAPAPEPPPPCDCDPNDADCICADPAPPLPPPVCQPRPPEACLDDSQCQDDERCDLTTTCPSCNEGDPACLAPCFIEGVCVPRPTSCELDEQCGPGFRCDLREICPPCAAPDPDDPNAPIACECFLDGQCVPEDSFCFSDFDCGSDQFCDFLDPVCGPPNPSGLIACAGICTDRDPVPPGVCLENRDCDPGFRCATELDVCVCPANDPDCQLAGVCFSQCVPADNGNSCFETADCSEGLVCDLDNFCDPPPDCPGCTVCAGRCVDPVDPTEGFCQSDEQCRQGQHCGFEVVECTQPPGTVDNDCWSICVDDSPSSRLCLEDADCTENTRCATEQDICYCPNNTTCEVCFSECVDI